MKLELGAVMQALYESEINCSVTTYWENGYDVRLGDELNGWIAKGNVKTAEEAAIFLALETYRNFPDSMYVVGTDAYEKRVRVRETLRKIFGVLRDDAKE